MEAGLSEISLQWMERSEHPLRSQTALGYASTRLRRPNLVNAEVLPQDSTSPLQVTLTKDKTTSDTTSMAKKSERDKRPPQPPQNVMTQLNPQQRKSSDRLWSRIPEHLRMARFGLDQAAWQPQDTDALGDTLCESEHRFSKRSTDLGHVTADPIRIVLKQDAPPVKQKPYRHSPFFVVKVRTEIEKLLLAGILRRSCSNWASAVVVVAKSDGRIRLTCNYKKTNERSIIPVLSLPVVDDLLSELGNSRVFSSIPLTAVCTQDGPWEWTVMSQGLVSSPG